MSDERLQRILQRQKEREENMKARDKEKLEAEMSSCFINSIGYSEQKIYFPKRRENGYNTDKSIL